MDVRTLLSPAKNPFFQHAEAQYFLARLGGRTGRANRRDQERRPHQTWNDRRVLWLLRIHR